MPDLTPRNNVPIPREFEEPYYQIGRDRDLAWDAGLFAESENSQLQFMDGGIIGWDADATDANTGVLFWGDTIRVSSYTTSFFALIDGPASVELTDGERLYFIMPRNMREDTTVQLIRANRIFFEGTRLHDLRLFAARVGDTIYFYNGLSLQDGEQGQVFGGGLDNTSIFPPHQHKDALKIEPVAAGLTDLDVLATAPDLVRVHVFRNGQRLAEPDDYTVNLASGIVTLVDPTVLGERFLVDRECQDPAAAATSHQHLVPLKVEPLPATVLLDALVTAPLLERVHLYRGGFRQAEPDDYSIDLNTGFITLVTPTVAGERFVIDREVNI